MTLAAGLLIDEVQRIQQCRIHIEGITGAEVAEEVVDLDQR